MRPGTKAAVRTPAETQLQGFINKSEPKHTADSGRCASAPEAHARYNFFVLSYGSTERPSDCIVTIAAAANGVGLSFYRGASLPDPKKILLGSGTQHRFIRVESADVLARPEIEALITAAIAQAKPPLPATGGGRLFIRSISVKQKSRRKSAQKKGRHSATHSERS